MLLGPERDDAPFSPDNVCRFLPGQLQDNNFLGPFLLRAAADNAITHVNTLR